MVDTVQCPLGLFYLTEYQVLLCLHCKAGVLPGKAAEVHWRNTHRWTGARLQAALAYAATLTLQDPHMICMPAQSARIPQLPVYSGYSCRGCDFLTSCLKRRQRHDQQQSHPESEAGWVQVRLQTFSHGQYTKYWTVQNEEEGEQGEGEEDTDHVASTSASLSSNEAWMQMVARQKQRDEERRQKQLTEVDNPEDLGKVST